MQILTRTTMNPRLAPHAATTARLSADGYLYPFPLVRQRADGGGAENPGAERLWGLDIELASIRPPLRSTGCATVKTFSSIRSAARRSASSTMYVSTRRRERPR